MELRASLSALLFSVSPPSTSKRSPWSSSQAVAWSWDGWQWWHGGVEGDAGMRVSYNNVFPSRSVPNAQLLCLPGMGPDFCPAPSSGRALGSELRAKPVPACPAQPFLTRLCFFQLDIFASPESTRRSQNVPSSSGFFN